jgi:hypothetical protein
MGKTPGNFTWPNTDIDWVDRYGDGRMVHEVGADEEVLNFLRCSRWRETCHLQGSETDQGNFTGVGNTRMLFQLGCIEDLNVELIARANEEGFLSVQARAQEERYKQ